MVEQTSWSPLSRVGLYHWGGPGTLRMNEVKYYGVKHDEASVLGCYDRDYLSRAVDLFSLTDIWVSYSWGFSDKTEQEDYDFVLSRLDDMKTLGLTVHAYIQGPNLVYDEFPNADWWARDERGRSITYYKGRWMCSIHHPDYLEFVTRRIERMAGLGFDGVFMDNIQHGQLGVPMPEGVLPFVFCGDASPAAQADFRAQTGCDIPFDFEQDIDLTRTYLDFRVQANTRFISHVADVVHQGGMVFGTNHYDPKFDPYYTYGIDIKAMAEVQDYVLFENHSLPTDDGARHNGYVEDLIRRLPITKPVFVVTYAEGVGLEPQFTQNQLDNVFSEGANANFHICVKGGEFTTRGRWHSLYLDGLKPPRTDKALPRQERQLDSELIAILFKVGVMRRFVKTYYNPIYTMAFEWRMLRFIVVLVYLTTLK